MANDSTAFDRKLVWVVQLSSALSLGTLAALIYSVQSVTPRIEFRLSGATLGAFALAAAASVVFWHLVFKLSNAPDEGSAPGIEGRTDKRRRLGLTLLSFGFAIALLTAFAYPLKDFSREKISEIGKGSFLALAFLTVLGVLFWRVVRYLERDEPPR